MTSDYDWHYNTVTQPGLNKTVYWPRGKVLGGSSAVNGLYMIRGSEIEHNSWASLTNSTDIWGWDAIYPYMMSGCQRCRFAPAEGGDLTPRLACAESENYTAPLAANQELANVIVDESYHGQDVSHRRLRQRRARSNRR